MGNCLWDIQIYREYEGYQGFTMGMLGISWRFHFKRVIGSFMGISCQYHRDIELDPQIVELMCAHWYYNGISMGTEHGKNEHVE